ncbi:hypothetical protein [Sorangium sp. So ce887]|uniref:hypothetical protein n=1 Tax=Sorangium sp. So ce887 TaxID=3133324 RepID=UPI003F60CFAD
MAADDWVKDGPPPEHPVGASDRDANGPLHRKILSSQESKKMSLFSKTVLPLTLLGAAAVLGGCVGEASLEGDDEQEIQPEAAEAADPESAESIDPEAAEAVGTAQQAHVIDTTTWTCWYYWHHAVWPVSTAEGAVTIWWGHHDYDATWACNKWVRTCYDSCYVSLSGTKYKE